MRQPEIPSKPLSDLPQLACLFNRQLARLPAYVEAHAEVARLLRLMQADAVRAPARLLYPHAQLQQHMRQTFASSLNLLFCAQQCATRAEHVPELVRALAWCSAMRDWDADLACGIINIPAEVWHAATGAWSAKIPPLPRGSPGKSSTPNKTCATCFSGCRKSSGKTLLRRKSFGCLRARCGGLRKNAITSGLAGDKAA